MEREGNAGKESRTCFVRAATFGGVRRFLLQAPDGVDEKLDDAYSLGWLEQAVVRVRVYDYHAYTDRVAMCPAWCIFGSSTVPDAYLGILFLYPGAYLGGFFNTRKLLYLFLIEKLFGRIFCFPFAHELPCVQA
jgi:hypothetical protein